MKKEVKTTEQHETPPGGVKHEQKKEVAASTR